MSEQTELISACSIIYRKDDAFASEPARMKFRRCQGTEGGLLHGQIMNPCIPVKVELTSFSTTKTHLTLCAVILWMPVESGITNT